MDIQKISILGGIGKDGLIEPVARVDFEMGQIVSIVGPTGSGKTTLIEDLELFADDNTPTRRRVLINDEAVPEEFKFNPARNPVALITQHTHFLSDMRVRKFLTSHATVRGVRIESIVEETLAFANELTGEPIDADSSMTELSGGQTRALLIADAVVIGHSPIILLDEIENAGINRTRALELLKRYRKIFIFVTHDPRIALLSDFRLVMRQGGMQKVIAVSDEEKRVAEEITKMDDLLLEFRTHIRDGNQLTESLLEDRLRALGYIE